MQTNYLEATSSVLSLMKKPDSVCKNINVHKTCYTLLFRHLSGQGIPFSMDAALDWLDLKKQEISHGTYSQYRNALFRLEHVRDGTVHSCIGSMSHGKFPAF